MSFSPAFKSAFQPAFRQVFGDGGVVASITYGLLNRVLDLYTNFTASDSTITDQSDEGNDAVLYSGQFVSTDATTDKAINADCSAEGSGTYYLTGNIRPDGVTTARQTLDGGSTTSDLTGLTADIWQTFQTADFTGTPSGVILGWNGTTFGGADYSDVKLHDASDDSVVARWQLNESGASDLDGFPAFDSVGDNHGTHTGCAGGDAEGVDEDVAALGDYGDNMWFDGVDDMVQANLSSTINVQSGVWRVKFKAYFPPSYVSGRSELFSVGSGSNGSLELAKTGEFIRLEEYHCGGVTGTRPLVAAPTGVILEVEFTYGGNTEASTLVVNGVSDTKSSYVNDSHNATHMSIGSATFGASGGQFSKASIWDVKLDIGNTGSYDQSYLGNGNIDSAWLDQIGTKHGTVSGLPVTVGQKRETILQTAGMDWNHIALFNNSQSISLGSTETLGDGESWSIQYYRASSTAGGALDHLWGDSVGTVTGLAIPSSNATWSLRGSSSSAGTSALAPVLDELDTVTVSRSGNNYTITCGNGSEVLVVGGDVRASAVGSRGGAEFFVGLLNAASFTAIDLSSVAGLTLFVPESNTTAGNDALGNAIVNPRINDKVLNLSGSSYAEVADDASLDLTTEATWEFFGHDLNEDRGAEAPAVFEKMRGSTRSWNIRKKGSNPDAIEVYYSTTGADYPSFTEDAFFLSGWHHYVVTFNLATFKLYRDGVLIHTEIDASASLNTTDITVLLGKTTDSNSCLGQSLGDLRIYAKELSATEVLNNYNTQKAEYGL